MLMIALGVVKLDPWLSPFSDALKRRFSKTQEWIKTINDNEGGLEKFSRVSFAFHHPGPGTDAKESRAPKSLD
jgi:hypothetical protein